MTHTQANLAPLRQDFANRLSTQNQLTAADIDANLNQQIAGLNLGDYQNLLSSLAPQVHLAGQRAALPYDLSGMLMGGLFNALSFT